MWCWFIKKKNHKVLHLFTIWEVWKSRNKFIFQYLKPSVVHVSIKMASSFSEFYKVRSLVASKIVHFPLFEDNQPIHLFYGVEQHGICGAGMVIYLRWNHMFKLWMGVGSGTNTREKLLALWGSLWFSKSHGLLTI